MFFQALQYFKFLLHSRNQHGVHSPFVYRLVTQCLYAKLDAVSLASYRKIQKESLLEKGTKGANYSFKKASILMQLCQYFKPKTVLEIGSFLGSSTSAIQISTTDASITTLEENAETAHIAKKIYVQQQYKHINFLEGDSSKTLPKVTQSQSYDLISFGEQDTQKEMIRSFENCLSAIHNDTVFVVNAIYQSKEMIAVWEYIKAHPKVRVTVDVFECGIVFFRKEQEKEHFKIRV